VIVCFYHLSGIVNNSMIKSPSTLKTPSLESRV
jgi:hypothetical protein